MWEGVRRRIATPVPFGFVARSDIRTLKIRMDSKPSPIRRIYHYKFCERLERPTVNYANTVGNVVKAAQTRVFVHSAPWNPPPSFNRVLQHAAGMLSKQIGQELGRSDLDEVLRKFPPKKRQMYGDGLDTPLDLKKHSRVTGFIKQENVKFAPEKDKPRAIQFRDPVFLSHLLPVMKPIEHAFYHNRYCFNRAQKFTCAKGMDPIARMDCLLQMVESVVDPMFVGLDGSAFDAHVSPGALRAEWKFYCKVLQRAGYAPVSITKFMEMGRMQLKNKVSFRCDDGFASYTCDGNRMSGDLNTGLGNSVLQSLFITSAMHEAGIPDENWRMLVDGDDAVLIVSRKYCPDARFITDMFERFSQDVKMEGPFPVDVNSMEVIDFCQSRPVNIDGQWRLVRDPYKVYNGYKQQCVYYRTADEAQRFLATIAPPEMIYASGVPVHASLFKAFHKLSGDKKPLEAVSRRFWLRYTSKSGVTPNNEVTWGTRDSYERAFGITVMDQLLIEQELEALEEGDLLRAELVLGV